MQESVTIGVPVYRGEHFLEEALRSIQAQTYRQFNVLISVDSSDPACEAICSRFLDDARFAMVVQPHRLGWVENLNWLLQRVSGNYWYYHQQDDLVDKDYLETLVGHLRRRPDAALAYCDIIPIGRISGKVFSVPPVTGSSFGRMMTMLQEHYPAFAFRGLARREAVRCAGPVNTNDVDNFGVDIVWLTGVARYGELHRVARSLYWKRYHDNNTESRWWTLSRADQLRYWARHCVDMLRQALQAGNSPEQCRLLWLASAARLTAPAAAGQFLQVADLSIAERGRLLRRFLDLADHHLGEELQLKLDAEWSTVRRMAATAHFLPRQDPVEIVAFGPDPVKRGIGFNPQPDGGSGLWVRTNRYPAPGSLISLNGHILGTVLQGTLATASVPLSLISEAGRFPISLVGRDGERRSTDMYLTVCE